MQDDPIGAVVQLDALSLQIGTVSILRELNAQLPLRGCTILLGANGSGKSSLLSVIQGLQIPTGGTVRLRGLPDESASTMTGQARRFATVFQRPVMLRRSALANVNHALACAGVPKGQRTTRATAALGEVGLGHLASRAARSLSGGEQQRLAIARASALNPMCLLCDEPTASLDPGAAVEVERLLAGLAIAGKGLIMATHDLAQARRLADYVVFMHRGQIRGQGSADTFFDQPPDPVAARFLRGELVGNDV